MHTQIFRTSLDLDVPPVGDIFRQPSPNKLKIASRKVTNSHNKYAFRWLQGEQGDTPELGEHLVQNGEVRQSLQRCAHVVRAGSDNSTAQMTSKHPQQRVDDENKEGPTRGQP